MQTYVMKNERKKRKIVWYELEKLGRQVLAWDWLFDNEDFCFLGCSALETGRAMR